MSIADRIRRIRDGNYEKPKFRKIRHTKIVSEEYEFIPGTNIGKVLSTKTTELWVEWDEEGNLAYINRKRY